MKIDNFFAELKRRNVYKVAIADGRGGVTADSDYGRGLSRFPKFHRGKAAGQFVLAVKLPVPQGLPALDWAD